MSEEQVLTQEPKTEQQATPQEPVSADAVAPETTTEQTAQEKPAQEGQEPQAAEPKTEEQKENHEVRRMKKYMREAAEARAELAAYRAALERQNAEQPAPSEGEPTREQFQSDQEYIKAQVDYQVRQVEQKFARQKQRETFEQTLNQARSELPDFEEVVEYNNAPINKAIQDAIESSPVGGYLLYEIAKNEELANRLAKLPPVIAVREIGKIEAKIEAARNKPKPAPVVPSKAPAPIKPVSTKGSAGPVDENTLSDAEWWKLEQRRRITKTKR